MILSFERDYWVNSGTLMDAVSAGVPVVCSDLSAAGALVERFGLGCLFEPEDVESLRDAVRSVPARLDPERLAVARDALSNRGVARAHLAAFGLGPPSSIAGS
jgi:hypothetical protein